MWSCEASERPFTGQKNRSHVANSNACAFQHLLSRSHARTSLALASFERTRDNNRLGPELNNVTPKEKVREKHCPAHTSFLSWLRGNRSGSAHHHGPAKYSIRRRRRQI